MEPMSDSINDIGGAHEPEFSAVAICIGSDFEGNPITLVDRLCLNRPAVEKVVGDMQICEQNAKAFEGQATRCEIKAVEHKNETTALVYGYGIALPVAIMIGLLLGRLFK